MSMGLLPLYQVKPTYTVKRFFHIVFIHFHPFSSFQVTKLTMDSLLKLLQSQHPSFSSLPTPSFAGTATFLQHKNKPQYHLMALFLNNSASEIKFTSKTATMTDTSSPVAHMHTGISFRMVKCYISQQQQKACYVNLTTP